MCTIVHRMSGLPVMNFSYFFDLDGHTIYLLRLYISVYGCGRNTGVKLSW